MCKTSIPADDAKFVNQVRPPPWNLASIPNVAHAAARDIKLIKDDYGYNWMIDGLPAAEMKQDLQTKEIFYDIGGFAL